MPKPLVVLEKSVIQFQQQLVSISEVLKGIGGHIGGVSYIIVTIHFDLKLTF